MPLSEVTIRLADRVLGTIVPGRDFEVVTVEVPEEVASLLDREHGSRASIRSRGVRKTSSKGRTTLEIWEFASTGSKGCNANVQTKKTSRDSHRWRRLRGVDAVIRAAVRDGRRPRLGAGRNSVDIFPPMRCQ